jgi:hypothetical protein
LKRIVLLITMGLVVTAMVAASALSASAQQYATTSEQAGYCARLVERVERIGWMVVLRLVQVALRPFGRGSLVQRVGRLGVG